jgi:hypothetical protein
LGCAAAFADIVRPRLNIYVSLPSSDPNKVDGRSSGRRGFPPFEDFVPQSFWCHFFAPDDDERCVIIGAPCSSLLLRAGSREWVDWVFKVEIAERGHKNSRFRKFASTVAFRAVVVEIHLADGFEGVLTMLGRTGMPRGAAWSSVKPGRGFGLKKQILSDCDLRNLSSVEDGAGVWKVVRIAANEAFAIDSWFSVFLSWKGGLLNN